MPTLSQASVETRKIFIWGAALIGVLILLFVLLQAFTFVKGVFFPTPPPKPTVFFGKLQPQVFPQNFVNRNFTYRVETISGNLPNFSDQVKVYRMEKVSPDLLALSKFQEKVRSAGFLTTPAKISDTVFEFSSDPNRGGIERKLRVNILRNNFTITSAYMSDPNVNAGTNLPSQSEAKRKATSLLTNMDLIPEDVNTDNAKVKLLGISNGQLLDSTSLSNTQILEVDFPQNEIDKKPVVYQNPNASSISILVGGGPFESEIVSANYNYQKVSNETSTYPIKTANQALSDLQRGNGYIAYYKGSVDSVIISNVYLAYYIGSQAQDFLMPVIVFEGSNDFVAYVPAVKDEWINR